MLYCPAQKNHVLSVPFFASAGVEVPTVTIESNRGIAIVAAFAILSLAAASSSYAQAHDMSKMNMPGHIMIPPGAIYTVADVEFMQGMIAHHAQAIYMSRMAAAHGASPRLLKLADKIDQSQVAEIRIMQDWLRSKSQMAPDTGSWRTMTMAGMLNQIYTLPWLDARPFVHFPQD